MEGAALCLAALAVAWALDLAWGEPRDAWHPVAWLGRVLAPVGAWCRARRTPAAAFAAGAAAWMALAVAVAVLGVAVEAGVRALPWAAGGVLLGVALKPLFAWRMLRDEVAAVEAALGDGLGAARGRLARLVSRDVSGADAADVRETAIETLAENLNDSVVAPLFWFAVAGLPGAAVYRFANTADAMWGYRGRWEWAGKCAARADDVLSFVPARLTAWLLRPLSRRGLRQEARRTPSPNGGWPMAAMALHLGVQLGKPGVYVLNAGARRPDAGDVACALRAATRAAWAAVLLAAAACGAMAWLGVTP